MTNIGESPLGRCVNTLEKYMFLKNLNEDYFSTNQQRMLDRTTVLRRQRFDTRGECAISVVDTKINL